MHNLTWTLTPRKPHINIIGCKWSYHMKYHFNGIIEHYKVYLITKKSIINKALIIMIPSFL